MKPSWALTISLFVYSVILFTVKGSEKEISSKELGAEHSEFSLAENRNKRDASEKEFEVYDKRPRELVGKRLRDFVGKRDPNEDGDVEEDLEETGLADKRLRDFVGKRYNDPYGFEKRFRDFVGKRSFDEQYDGYDKRLRDFVGKRGLYEFPEPYNFIEEEESDAAEKRLRDFVGKRNSKDIILRPPRELVGKRFRDFVGKRDFGKRVRDFVGKRDFYPLDYTKRIRELLG